MRILLDEDVALQVLEPLRHVLRDHRVDHVQRLGWSGKKDLFVLRDAAAQHFEVLVTNDARQLDDPAETAAIKKCGLHHVRFRQRYELGLNGLALALGAVVSAMPFVVAELAAASGQRLVRISSIQASGRHSTVDPSADPPKYWPR
ncbi:hypothetical protein Kfla_6856 [Kribbella flavida DSM 17836]|uniref:VapC45 PIN like domain-containing protein n=1 Tax=Kribbella flavida (strain DSM 17836 / JCM 10339 / NBRC 14399) TaxID=479435 RepID=D2Q2F0_KRIFD|nr:DUF5615 family PIN-like protein [Kribbella flavida]ADB35846.1 hypothetical protein Kfla_6856 [Kribbella flavida DSM 17836]